MSPPLEIRNVIPFQDVNGTFLSIVGGPVLVDAPVRVRQVLTVWKRVQWRVGHVSGQIPIMTTCTSMLQDRLMNSFVRARADHGAEDRQVTPYCSNLKEEP
ncbi:hypothetical protein [Phyllobacterium sp. SB3]|uniref:hypothetical protein n=1 Tax=Phyllobacterium sp. SB3 TaxID=3156073 RepID=UPI0032B01B02